MKRLLSTLFLLSITSTGWAQTEEAQTLSPIKAEHCVEGDGDRSCFKQIIDAESNSTFFVTLDSWETLINVRNLDKTGFEFQIVSEEEFAGIETDYDIAYDVEKIQDQLQGVVAVDAIRVIYQNPRKCGCAAGVVGASLSTMVAGAGLGAKFSAPLGPYAAGGVVIGATAGAIVGAIGGVEKYCKKDGGKKDC